MSMITLTLLDFSSGDCELRKADGIPHRQSTKEAETQILAEPDHTTVLLQRAYSKGSHQTTVGELRSTIALGWWGW